MTEWPRVNYGNIQWHEASRGHCATAELLILFVSVNVRLIIVDMLHWNGPSSYCQTPRPALRRSPDVAVAPLQLLLLALPWMNFIDIVWALSAHDDGTVLQGSRSTPVRASISAGNDRRLKPIDRMLECAPCTSNMQNRQNRIESVIAATTDCIPACTRTRFFRAPAPWPHYRIGVANDHNKSR